MTMREILIYLMIIIILLTAGCTQPAAIQKESSSPATAEKIQNSSFPEYPAPPAEIAVTAQINDKDKLNNEILVFFSGGAGQKMVKKTWAVIRRSDGSLETFTMKPQTRDEVTMIGTDGDDQVRVYAEYYNGETYMIGDKILKKIQRI